MKPVVCPQRGAQQFIIEDDETESELSLGSRSFLNRVNDQVRKKTKTIFNGCDRRQREAFCDMGNVHVFNIAIICIHEEMKQMFDISATLVSEQDEIYGVKTINRESSSWKHLSLISDEQIINLQRTKVYVFSDSVWCLGKMNENLDQT